MMRHTGLHHNDDRSDRNDDRNDDRKNPVLSMHWPQWHQNSTTSMCAHVQNIKYAVIAVIAVINNHISK